MTMTQNERQALTDNWDQAKEQIRSQFPGVNDDDLNQGRQDPGQFASTVADRTGQDKSQVEQSLKQIAKQYSNS